MKSHLSVMVVVSEIVLGALSILASYAVITIVLSPLSLVAMPEV